MLTCFTLAAALVVGGMFIMQQERLARGVAEAANFTPAPLATSEPSVEPIDVAFIGDSYTVGAGSTNGGFVKLLSKGQPWDVINLGVGGTGYAPSQGATEGSMNACGRESCPGYIDVIPQAVEGGADVVVVSGGRNEAKVPADAQAATIDAFYKKLRAELPDAKIIAFSPIWDSEPAPAAIPAMAGMVRTSVEAVGGTFIDLGQPLEGKADLITADGVHPNNAGYEALADAMRGALTEVASAP